MHFSPLPGRVGSTLDSLYDNSYLLYWFDPLVKIVDGKLKIVDGKLKILKPLRIIQIKLTVAAFSCTNGDFGHC